MDVNDEYFRYICPDCLFAREGMPCTCDSKFDFAPFPEKRGDFHNFFTMLSSQNSGSEHLPVR